MSSKIQKCQKSQKKWQDCQALWGIQDGSILILAQKQVIWGMGSDPIEKWAFCNFDTGSISPEFWYNTTK